MINFAALITCGGMFGIFIYELATKIFRSKRRVDCIITTLAAIVTIAVGSIVDSMTNPDYPTTDNELVKESLRTEVERMIKLLGDREQKVIKAFFGIGEPELTLEEIGVKYNLTRERVRQIKEKAIRRIRHNTKNKLLKSYLG